MAKKKIQRLIKPQKKKYMWTSVEFDAWAKQEAKRMRQCGFKNVCPADVTHTLLHKVIIPKGIELTKVKKKRTKKHQY